jgi:hypothetical protein
MFSTDSNVNAIESSVCIADSEHRKKSLAENSKSNLGAPFAILKNIATCPSSVPFSSADEASSPSTRIANERVMCGLFRWMMVRKGISKGL